MTEDFLIEIGCEELPPKPLKSLAIALRDNIAKGFDKANLKHEKITWFAAPRRLAVRVSQLATQQQDSQVQRRGPSVDVAFDDSGQPTKAALGFANSCGIAFDELTRQKTDKGEWLYFQAMKKGLNTVEVLPDLISEAIAQLPIAKSMRWGNGTVEFVRPVHWILMLLGETVVPAEILGVQTGNQTQGHRFHRPQKIAIRHPNDYEQVLYDANVIVDFAKRQEVIKQQIAAITESLNAVAVMPQELLDEVTAIVEWPQALLASFNAAFLSVPSEALIAAMQGHQKSFALTDNKGQLRANFITVANIASQDPERVIRGNQKVMNARLSDADFFFKQDTNTPLSRLIERTKTVVFQKQLGSVFDKTQRVLSIATMMADKLTLDKENLERAVTLSKCDLMSEMVGEFPELQGVMGYYYAKHDKENESVAIALRDQYLPKYSGDELPLDEMSCVISIAERVDTLVGIFAIGQKPSGVKDPFKLRRHALALVRLLSEKAYPFTLSDLLKQGLIAYQEKFKTDKIEQELHRFIIDRLVAWYHGQGFSHELIKACKARQQEDLFDFAKRLDAVKEFMSFSQAQGLAQANKRVSKLLASAKLELDGCFDNNLFQLAQETELATAINLVEQGMAGLVESRSYIELLELLSSLHQPVDGFFEQVMVMDDDLAIRHNRLNLLTRLRRLFLHVADISLL